MGSFTEPLTSQALLQTLCDPSVNEWAWQTFQERYQPLIRHWCARWRLQPADLDDVTQQVLVKVFTQVKTYDSGQGRFRPWLRTVVHHTVLDFFRQKERHPADWASGNSSVQEILKAIAQPESVENLAGGLADRLKEDLDRLLARVQQRVQPETWQIFVQAELEGRSKEEVARAMGRSYAAVCMCIHRVSKMLRQEWAAGQQSRGQPPQAGEPQP